MHLIYPVQDSWLYLDLNVSYLNSLFLIKGFFFLNCRLCEKHESINLEFCFNNIFIGGYQKKAFITQLLFRHASIYLLFHSLRNATWGKVASALLQRPLSTCTTNTHNHPLCGTTSVALTIDEQMEWNCGRMAGSTLSISPTYRTYILLCIHIPCEGATGDDAVMRPGISNEVL